MNPKRDDKKPGKRDHKQFLISSHVTHAHALVFLLLKWSQFPTTIIDFLMRHRHQTGTIFAYQPTISDRRH
jgi:hypothetical protein